MIHYSEYTLRNGLRVVANRDRLSALAAVNMLYGVGARNEAPERTGFAHLFEHLMFRGTKLVPDFDMPVQVACGENNAFTNNGANTVLFFFGAFFGRILLDTGIAPALIRKTVELGGDRPVVTTILLTLVVAGIFTSMFGTGAVIAMGVIVLPILLSLGIDKRVALTSFMLAKSRSSPVR